MWSHGRSVTIAEAEGEGVQNLEPVLLKEPVWFALERDEEEGSEEHEPAEHKYDDALARQDVVAS